MTNPVDPSMDRRLAALWVAAGLCVIGLVMLIYSLSEGGTFIPLGGLVLLAAGVFWIRKDWYPPRAKPKG